VLDGSVAFWALAIAPAPDNAEGVDGSTVDADAVTAMGAWTGSIISFTSGLILLHGLEREGDAGF